MRKVELPEAVLDLLKEVAPNALLRIARGDGAELRFFGPPNPIPPSSTWRKP